MISTKVKPSGFINIFKKLPPVEPDPILGLTDRCKRDDRPEKVNVSIGLFVDSEGNALMPEVVKEVDSKNAPVGYLPISGDAGFVHLTNVRFGQGKYSCGIQTLGSTQAVRLALELFKKCGCKHVIIPTPTWPNHIGITKELGLNFIPVNHLSPNQEFNQEGILESIRNATEPTCIILQPFCHNPTGVDISLEQASAINDAILAKGGVVQLILDCSYLGFRDPAHERATLDTFIVPHCLAISYSKNLGLYSRRTGVLLFSEVDSETAEVVVGNLQSTIRTINSSPPVDGMYIASQVLKDDEKFERWKAEMVQWREQIMSLRAAFAEPLNERARSLITSQHGLFGFIPVELLREELRVNKAAQEMLIKNHALYTVQLPQGLRISIPGLRNPEIAQACGKLVAECLA